MARRDEAALRGESADLAVREVRMPPRLATFPSQDQAFELFVQTTRMRLQADGRPLTPESLEAALRTFHTRALVRPRDPLAALAEDVWYVYRDGHAGVQVENDWWRCDDCARVVFDRSGAFVAADDAACALLGVAPGGLAGRHWREFVRGRAPRESSASLWELLETRGIQSVFDAPLADGGYRVIEYHSEPTEDPDRFTSRWRAIAEIREEQAAEEATPSGGR